MRRLLERIRCAVLGHTLPMRWPNMPVEGAAKCPRCEREVFGYLRLGSLVEWWRL